VQKNLFGIVDGFIRYDTRRFHFFDCLWAFPDDPCKPLHALSSTFPKFSRRSERCCSSTSHAALQQACSRLPRLPLVASLMVATLSVTPITNFEEKAQRAERERERRTGRLVTSFAPTVSVAALAASESPDGMLPQSVLAALLEDPSHMLSGTLCQNNTYEEVPVVWQQLGTLPFSSSVLWGVQHETSQLFARPLSFGRRRCFRLHRFRLCSESALAMTSALSQLALQRAASDSAGRCKDAGIRGSNVGGFQQLLASDSTLAHDLRSAFTGAIRQVAAADRTRVLEEEPSTTPPVSPRCDAFAAWMNVSFKGSLNHIHNHGENTWAAVAYTKIPAVQSSRNEGALLLRLTRGRGARFMEPDEDLHVPYMALHPGADAAEIDDGIYTPRFCVAHKDSRTQCDMIWSADPVFTSAHILRTLLSVEPLFQTSF
jgi:hypothetical protein